MSLSNIQIDRRVAYLLVDGMGYRLVDDSFKPLNFLNKARLLPHVPAIITIRGTTTMANFVSDMIDRTGLPTDFADILEYLPQLLRNAYAKNYNHVEDQGLIGANIGFNGQDTLTYSEVKVIGFSRRDDTMIGRMYRSTDLFFKAEELDLNSIYIAPNEPDWSYDRKVGIAPAALINLAHQQYAQPKRSCPIGGPLILHKLTPEGITSTIVGYLGDQAADEAAINVSSGVDTAEAPPTPEPVSSAGGASSDVLLQAKEWKNGVPWFSLADLVARTNLSRPQRRQFLKETSKTFLALHPEGAKRAGQDVLLNASAYAALVENLVGSGRLRGDAFGPGFIRGVRELQALGGPAAGSA